MSENNNNNNNFNSSVESLFRGMENFLTTKTVVGDAIRVDDHTLILPLVDVTFGCGAGAASKNTKGSSRGNSAAGGMAGKISPNSVLVIQNGRTKLINMRNTDNISRIIDLVPDFVNKFISGKDSVDLSDDQVKAKVDQQMKGEE